MLIACLIAFAILVAAWLVLPSSEVAETAKTVEVTKRDTITAS